MLRLCLRCESTLCSLVTGKLIKWYVNVVVVVSPRARERESILTLKLKLLKAKALHITQVF